MLSSAETDVSPPVVQAATMLATNVRRVAFMSSPSDGGIGIEQLNIAAC
jgi:hypothetical protein